ARSVIPDHTLHGELQKLTRLGSKPLGAVLFANKHINRGAIEIGRVSRGHQLHRTALMFSPEKPRQVWGRRSLFYITRHPLLVNEFFLPQIQPKSFTRHAS
ncbi:MAG TPA: chorismate lyase, partial [Gammaproteobacteria bacterium]|nr:chorismate lyase [Gammaproteobacteria bacterium]